MPEETEMTVGRLIELLSDYPKDFKVKFDSWREGIEMDISTIDVRILHGIVYLEEAD